MLIKANDPNPSSRPTVVLVPGGPGEAADGFRGLLEKKEILNALYTHLKLNVILFDPRATGESTLPDQTDSSLSLTKENMSFRLLIEDFEALIDYYKLDKVIIMSHSMGSFTAMKFAERNPGKVDKLIMISPSPGIKSLGDINLLYYGKNFPLLEQHLQAVNDPNYTKEFSEAFNLVNEITLQQQKAQILSINNYPEFSGISVNLLRKEILKRLGDINLPNNDLLSFLKDVKNDFLSIAPLTELVSEDLKAAKIEFKDLIYNNTSYWRMIANHLICTESLSEEQKDQDSIYDGLSYRFRCPAQSESYVSVQDIDSKKVLAPALIFTGSNDSQVPYFMQKKLVESLPNSYWEVVPSGDHFPPNKEPMRFYNAIESFIYPNIDK